jgi:hypothetical protein
MSKKTTKKIFLPKWQIWYIIPVMLGIWGFMTYMEFFNPTNTDKMGMVGYGFMTILFWGISVMMWMMTSGKLPAYIIEEEEK